MIVACVFVELPSVIIAINFYITIFAACVVHPEWYWKCMIYPWSMWILSFVVILLSIIVVWSECLFFIVEPVLSIFARLVQLAATKQNYFAIEVLATYVLSALYVNKCRMLSWKST